MAATGVAGLGGEGVKLDKHETALVGIKWKSRCRAVLRGLDAGEDLPVFRANEICAARSDL